MFRVNLVRGFLYPLRQWRRLLMAWLVVPVGVVALAPLLILAVAGWLSVDIHPAHLMELRLGMAAVLLTAATLPGTLLAGYLLRARRAVIAGDSSMPVWSGWGRLLAEGTEMGTLALLIGLPTLAFFWAGVISVGGHLVFLNSHRTWGALLLALLGSGVGLACLVMALCLYLVVMLFAPMATLRLALGKSALGALSPRGLVTDIRKGWFDYLICCLLLGLLSAAFGVAQAAFWPLILLSYPVQVYLQLVWASLLGQYARGYLAAS